MLGTFEQLTVVGFLLATSLSLGLRCDLAESVALLRSRVFLARVLFANFVVVPLIAWALLQAVPLAHGPREALLILALFPGGVSAVRYTSKVKGEEATASAVVVLLSVLSVLFSPLLLRSVLPEEVDFSVPWLQVLGVYGLLLLAPLAAGLWLGRRGAFWSHKLPKFLGILSIALFIAFVLSTKKFRLQAVASIGWAAVGAMLALILGAMVAGWYLGGPIHGRRQVLASSTSMRNAILALAIARDSPAGATVMPSLLAFSLLMLTPNKVFSLWHLWRARRAKSTKA